MVTRGTRKGRSLVDSKQVLLAVFSHMYLLFVVGSIVSMGVLFAEAGFSLVGLSEADVINYLVFSSVFVLAGSMLLKWTLPSVPEEGLVIVLVWFLYGNVFRASCMCCSSWSAEHEASISHWLGCSVCDGNVLGFVYSAAWFATMVLSYVVDLRTGPLARVFQVLAVVATALLLLLPNRCNQFSELSQTLLFAKITVFHVAWHINRTRRIQERVLMSTYLSFAKAPRVLGNRVRAGHASLKRVVPARLFSLLRTWYYKRNPRNISTRHWNLFDPRWLSWKNRNYSANLAHLFEMLGSAWILGSCRWFAWGFLLQLFWTLLNMHWNSRELAFVLNERDGLPSLLSVPTKKTTTTTATNPATAPVAIGNTGGRRGTKK